MNCRTLEKLTQSAVVGRLEEASRGGHEAVVDVDGLGLGARRWRDFRQDAMQLENVEVRRRNVVHLASISAPGNHFRLAAKINRLK